jgi:hypothetical protein
LKNPPMEQRIKSVATPWTSWNKTGFLRNSIHWTKLFHWPCRIYNMFWFCLVFFGNVKRNKYPISVGGQYVTPSILLVKDPLISLSVNKLVFYDYPFWILRNIKAFFCKQLNKFHKIFILR